VAIAKNYFNEAELRALNNLVEQYLIFAQSQAERRVPMAMHDWIAKLKGFLTLNDREILTHAGVGTGVLVMVGLGSGVGAYGLVGGVSKVVTTGKTGSGLGVD